MGMHVGGIYIRIVCLCVVSALLLKMFYGCNTDTSNSFAFSYLIRGFETKSFCLELWLIYLWLVRVEQTILIILTSLSRIKIGNLLSVPTIGGCKVNKLIVNLFPLFCTVPCIQAKSVVLICSDPCIPIDQHPRYFHFYSANE